ncbi:hypothetical protein RB213_006464 [Colletotrichum asianum]
MQGQHSGFQSDWRTCKVTRTPVSGMAASRTEKNIADISTSDIEMPWFQVFLVLPKARTAAAMMRW